jgi:hypothetical protein
MAVKCDHVEGDHVQKVHSGRKVIMTRSEKSMICRLRFVSGNRELKRASPWHLQLKDVLIKSQGESWKTGQRNCSHCRPNCRAQWTLCVEDSLAYLLGNGRNCHRRS